MSSPSWSKYPRPYVKREINKIKWPTKFFISRLSLDQDLTVYKPSQVLEDSSKAPIYTTKQERRIWLPISISGEVLHFSLSTIESDPISEQRGELKRRKEEKLERMNWISRKIHLYNVTMGLYMLDWWERYLFSILVLSPLWFPFFCYDFTVVLGFVTPSDGMRL